MGKKTVIALASILLILLLLSGGLWWWNSSVQATKRLAQQIEIGGIRLLMTRDEVEAKLGPGPVDDPRCFGCGMETLYPVLRVSGRYSETDKRSGSPVLKKLTTSDERFSVLGVSPGDRYKEAAELLHSRGFELQNDPNAHDHMYYKRHNFYIRLWPDAEVNWLLKKDRNAAVNENEPIGSITVEIRVPEDEQIQY